MTEPRRICSWCKRDMGPGDPALTDNTHGICPDCETKMNDLLAEMEIQNESNNQSQKPQRV